MLSALLYCYKYITLQMHCQFASSSWDAPAVWEYTTPRAWGTVQTASAAEICHGWIHSSTEVSTLFWQRGGVHNILFVW